jgi:hypothetical protein
MVTIVQAIQRATIATDIPLLRRRFGNNSVATTQIAGPSDAAKKAIYPRINRRTSIPEVCLKETILRGRKA